MRTMLHRAIGLAALAFIPLRLAAQGAVLDSTTISNETIVLEVHVGQLAARTIPAIRRDAIALLPLRELLRLVEIPLRTPLPTRYSFERPGDQASVMLDITRGELTVAGRRRSLGDDAMQVVGGEPLLSLATLAALLHVDLEVDWEELRVNLRDPAELPIAERSRRDAARRAALDHSTDTDGPPVDITSARSDAGGLAIDYAIQSVLATGATSWSVGVGSELMRGGVTMAIDHAFDGATRVDASWLRGWSGLSGIAQLGLGDGISTGLHPRATRGFMVSNAPLTRPDDYGVLPFGGLLANGWSVEAWRGGRIVAYDSVDAAGRFRLDVPVQYGENALALVAYGPDGEIRRYSRAWNLAADAVAPGRLVYGFAGGACRSAECDASANADLRYGMAKGWTARVGVDQFWRHDPGPLLHPYAELLGTLATGIGMQLSVVRGAVAQAELSWAPSASFRGSLIGARFDTTTIAPILTQPGRSSQLTGSMSWQHRSTSLDLAVDQISGTNGVTRSTRLAASTATGRVQWLGSIASVAGDTRYGAAGIGVAASVDAILVGVLAGTTLRLGGDEQSGRVQRLRAAIGLPLSQTVRIDANASWSPVTRSTQLHVMVVGDLAFFRTTSTAGSTADAPLSQSIQGSVAFDPARGSLTPRALPTVSHGGVSGRACLDMNNDGRCSADEPPIAGLRIVAAGRVATTDADGRWTLWDLPPYAQTAITLDTTSLPAPYLVPPFRQALITPAANRFITLDLPMVPGGVAEGIVVMGDSTPAAGMLLRLRRVGGSDHVSLRTFSDGAFYAVGLRPGDWEVRPDAADTGALGAAQASLVFTIPSTADGASVAGLRLVLRRISP